MGSLPPPPATDETTSAGNSNKNKQEVSDRRQVKLVFYINGEATKHRNNSNKNNVSVLYDILFHHCYQENSNNSPIRKPLFNRSVTKYP